MMGCDIHMVIEEKANGRWIGVMATDRLAKRPVIAQRDYAFFGEVASVRMPSKSNRWPNGLPFDVSELSWYLFSLHGADYHSASHMGLSEFCASHNRVNPSQSREQHCVYDLTGISEEEAREYRVVFWFDN